MSKQTKKKLEEHLYNNFKSLFKQITLECLIDKFQLLYLESDSVEQNVYK